MKADIYTAKGEKKGSATLPEEIFGLPWNADLVHQVVTSIQSNRRTPVAHAKGRNEVRGGGAKPWRQKGTGNARHGSIRSPLWIGGGVTHGPLKGKDYTKKINKKMRSKALFTILSRKLVDGEIVFLESLSELDSEGKTKEAKNIVDTLSKVKGLEGISRKKGNAALIALGDASAEIKRSFKNIPTVSAHEVENLSALDVLNYKYIVITDPERSIEFLKSKNN
ncbi:MAG: 50S ribosomal protein L4 [Candidatus Campbellbacteria bacterium]|nr:50S ribosomal protein L4 [Candidatus Campbellbacteria bacterium]